MNLDIEAALKIVDEAVNQHLGRGLNPPEEAVIKGTWQKIGYKEMEKTTEFSRNYLMRDVAPRLWKLLSHVFGEPVNKHNFRSVLENLSANQEQIEVNETVVFRDRLQPKLSNTATSLSEPWKEVTEGSFIGRETELNTLKQWIIDRRAQLISVLGIAGIGKTALCQEFVRLYGDLFDCVVWQEISPPLSLSKLVEQLTKKVAYLFNKEGDRPSQQLEYFLEVIEKKRCLIVLDGVETLLEPATINREYQPEYDDYQQFFQKIAAVSHQSCLVVTSTENPKNNLALETDKSTVHSLLLSGLTVEDADILLGNQNGNKANWQNLSEIYQGHPLALKLAQKTIEDIFNGNVEEFLAQKILIFGEIEELLAQIFKRLTPIEQEILYCLAAEAKPVTMSYIQKKISVAGDRAKLMSSFVSLERRGLLETPEIKGESLFSLGSMIAAYISKKLIERVSSTSISPSSEGSLAVTEDIIDLSAPANSQQANLSNWLQGNFEADWQSIEKLLLNTQKLASRLRGAYYLESGKSIKRCKAIALDQILVVLLVEIKPDSQQNTSIRVQVYPSSEKSTLPDKLKLSLINHSGESLREVVSRGEDNFIQLPLFRGKSPEEFGIELSIGTDSIKESFTI